MVENDNTVVIDASTAYRVDDNWAYGFPGKNHDCFFVQRTFVFLTSAEFYSYP